MLKAIVPTHTTRRRKARRDSPPLSVATDRPTPAPPPRLSRNDVFWLVTFLAMTGLLTAADLIFRLPHDYDYCFSFQAPFCQPQPIR